MKRTITLFMLALIPAILSAQPTITNAENFSIGTVLTFQQCNSTGVNPGNSGASQTWNFSTLTSLGTTSIETMVTPASTTHGNLFPTSNLVEQYSNGTFVYVNATVDSSYLVGNDKCKSTTAYNSGLNFKRAKSVNESLLSLN